MEKDKFFDLLEENVREILVGRDPDNEISRTTYMKNNDQERTGLILKRKGSDLCPVFYMDDFYEAYQGGMSLEDLIEWLVNAFENSDIQDEEVGFPEDYEDIKPFLSLRLVEIERNREWLQDKIYDTVGIFARVCYLNAGRIPQPIEEEGQNGVGMMIMITKDILEQYPCSEEQILKDALENLRREALRAHLYSVEDLIRMAHPDMPMRKEEQNSGTILVTSADRTLGAVMITLPQIQQKVAEILGSGYYVIPSSIHEVICIREKQVASAEILAQNVRLVNQREVIPSEVLSDSLMFYDAERKELIFL